MAAILMGVSLKDIAQIAHFSAPVLYVALERGTGKRLLRM